MTTKIKILACWCTAEDSDILAVVIMTPTLAAELLTKRDTLIQLKNNQAGISSQQFNDGSCRFFHSVFNNNESAIDTLFKEVADVSDELDLSCEWFDITGITVPETGDYRLAFSNLNVSEFSIYWEFAAKHAEESLETKLLDLDHLREIASTAYSAPIPSKPIRHTYPFYRKDDAWAFIAGLRAGDPALSVTGPLPAATETPWYVQVDRPLRDGEEASDGSCVHPPFGRL